MRPTKLAAPVTRTDMPVEGSARWIWAEAQPPRSASANGGRPGGGEVIGGGVDEGLKAELRGGKGDEEKAP